MPRSFLSAALLAGALTFLLWNASALGAGVDSYGPGSCGGCHSKSVRELESSVHAPEKLAAGGDICLACHDSHTKADASAANAPLVRERDVSTCGECHAEQLEIFRSTYHGKHLSLGKANAPTCTFCHAGHELPRGNLESGIHPANVGRICASCHAVTDADKIQMASTLAALDTGSLLYRKKLPVAPVIRGLGSMLTLAVLLLGILFLLQWIRNLRGEPEPRLGAWPPWAWGVVVAYVAAFVVLDQSGIALLYGSASHDAVSTMMHGATRTVMGLLGSADIRSLVHRLGGGLLIATFCFQLIAIILCRSLRSSLRLPTGWVAELWKEARRGTRPGSASSKTKLVLMFWLLFGLVLTMLVSGVVQWRAFAIMGHSGFGPIRAADAIHESAGRATAILTYGILFGYGIMLRGVLRIANRRSGGMGASMAVLVAMGIVLSLSACGPDSRHEAKDVAMHVTPTADQPALGSVVAPLAVGTVGNVFPSAETCRGCHSREYDEWTESYHSKSVSGETFRAMYTIFDFGTQGQKPEYCFNCHAPESKVLGDTYIQELSAAVLAGTALPSEGITCGACHMTVEVDVANHDWFAPVVYDINSTPPYHEVYRSEITRSSDLCSPCHDYNNMNIPHPGEETTPCCTVNRGWKETEAAKEGIGCQSCHMRSEMGVAPEESALSRLYELTGLHRYVDDRNRVSHVMPGSRDTAMLQRAVEMDLREVGREGNLLSATLRIENLAAHNIPDG
jgi:Cytochrome c554 and c-prime